MFVIWKKKVNARCRRLTLKYKGHNNKTYERHCLSFDQLSVQYSFHPMFGHSAIFFIQLVIKSSERSANLVGSIFILNYQNSLSKFLIEIGSTSQKRFPQHIKEKPIHNLFFKLSFAYLCNNTNTHKLINSYPEHTNALTHE